MNKEVKTRVKLFLKIIVLGIIIFVLLAVGFGFYLTRGLESGGALSIQSIDVAKLKDGIYVGKYENGRWSNEIAVAINEGKIVDIHVRKSVFFERKEITNSLFQRVLEKQNTNVDVISGATVTSKAYLKSIENALTN